MRSPAGRRDLGTGSLAGLGSGAELESVSGAVITGLGIRNVEALTSDSFISAIAVKDIDY